jgi:hypothetical protein
MKNAITGVLMFVALTCAGQDKYEYGYLIGVADGINSFTPKARVTFVLGTERRTISENKLKEAPLQDKLLEALNAIGGNGWEASARQDFKKPKLDQMAIENEFSYYGIADGKTGYGTVYTMKRKL